MTRTQGQTSARHWLVVAVAAIALLQPTFAQQKSFDAASVRVNKEPGRPGTVGTTMRTQPSGITFLEVTLLNCISAAYGVTSYQIKGPDWIRTEAFDIVARSGAPASRQDLMNMLQTLLVERFKLRIHREKARMRAYALVVTKQGARLKPTADQSGEKTQGTGPYPFAMARADRGWTFTRASMADLAGYLSNAGPIGVPVIDETKLAGYFDFNFPLVVARREGDNSGPTAYLDALAELGLTMDSRQIPVDVIVVDSAERNPAPN
jgi:uncharacterized protein (TIGR03435 family)